MRVDWVSVAYWRTRLRDTLAQSAIDPKRRDALKLAIEEKETKCQAKELKH